MLERCPEVLHINVLVGDEKEFPQRELTLAENAERARHGFAPVPLLDDRRGQRVIAGLAVRPEPLDSGHHEREERRQQLLQQIADEEVLLPWLADDGGRIDRVGPMRDPLTSKTG